MLNIYLVVSALLLTFVASIWTGRGYVNLFVKTMFAASAFFGAVMVAKFVVHI